MTTEWLLHLERCFDEDERTRFHEAAHVVLAYIFGFRPRLMQFRSDPIMHHDRRTTAFFRQRKPWNSVQRAKVDDYAVMTAVGVLAEYKKSSCRSLDDLWPTAGVDDWKCLYQIALMVWKHEWPREWLREQAVAEQIAWWIERGRRALENPTIWNAIERLAMEAELYDVGVIRRDELTKILKTLIPRSRSAHLRTLVRRLGMQAKN